MQPAWVRELRVPKYHRDPKYTPGAGEGNGCRGHPRSRPRNTPRETGVEGVHWKAQLHSSPHLPPRCFPHPPSLPSSALPSLLLRLPSAGSTSPERSPHRPCSTKQHNAPPPRTSTRLDTGLRPAAHQPRPAPPLVCSRLVPAPGGAPARAARGQRERDRAPAPPAQLGPCPSTLSPSRPK